MPATLTKETSTTENINGPTHRRIAPGPRVQVVPRSAAATATQPPATNFTVIDWTGEGEGEKVMVYSKSGEGKTSLAAQLPNAIFLATDDGGKKIVNPVTGKLLRAINPKLVYDFPTAHAAIRRTDLWSEGSTAVIDTLTKLEEWAQNDVALSNKKASFKDVGWNGPGYLQDKMRAFMADLEVLLRKGVNIVLLCQQSEVTVANAAGADYLEAGPKLLHQRGVSIRTDLIEWCDHVVRIGRSGLVVTKDQAEERLGKVRNTLNEDGTTEGMSRVILTDGPLHYVAKSRPNPVTHERLPPVISFADPKDDSFWQLLFSRGD